MAAPTPSAVCERYLERCQRVQNLVNFHTVHRTTLTSIDTKIEDPVDHPMAANIPPASCNDPEELHITGTDVLREWIDISELAVHRRETLEHDVGSDKDVGITGISDGPQNGDDVESQVNPGTENVPPHQQDARATMESKIEIVDEGVRKLPIPDPHTTSDVNWADVDVVEKTFEEGPTEEKFKCDQCAYKTNWKNNMTKHVISRHQASEEIRWFECAHCTYRGKTREYLLTHLRGAHGQFTRWHSCKHCPAKFKYRSSLKVHVTSRHTAADKIKWFKCDQCDYKATTTTKLKQHVLHRHTDKQDIAWFQCGTCDYLGKTKMSLKRHVATMHTGVDKTVWRTCKKCGMWMTKLKSLKLHQRSCRGPSRRRIADEFENRIVPTYVIE